MLAACGGHAPASRAQVRLQADAICTQTLSAIRAVPPPSATARSEATYLHRVLPLLDSETRRLAGLPRPQAGHATLVRFIAAVSAADRAYHRAATDAGRGDAAAAVADLAALRSSDVTTLARSYGLAACTGTGATGA